MWNNNLINEMDSLGDSCWDFIDYSALFNDTNFDLIIDSNPPEFDAPLSSGAVLQVNECAEKECSRKRGRSESCGSIENKACRERQRREKLNERFLELSSTLEPGRPASTDKLAILGDSIRVLNQLNAELQEIKETKEKLQEEIKTLKAEKNELRKEKLALKADKALMEQQLKTMTGLPAWFMPAHPRAAYKAVPNKMQAHPGATFPAERNNMPVYPSYSVFPMWHYLPPSVRDTSHDHELRPPAA